MPLQGENTKPIRIQVFAASRLQQRHLRGGAEVGDEDRLEVWYDEQRTLTWSLTTKVPLRGKNGKIIGRTGRDEGRSRHQPSSEVSHIQKKTSRILSTAELARKCSLSERTLYPD